MPTLIVLLPAFNEAANIGAVVAGVRAVRIEGVDALGWRRGVHAVEVLAQQRVHPVIGQVVLDDAWPIAAHWRSAGTPFIAMCPTIAAY